MTVNAILLQIVNGYVAVTALVGALVFLRYLNHNKSSSYQDLSPALAIFGVFLGGVVLWMITFYYRIMINSGIRVDYPVYGVLLGSLLIEIAFLCKIRVFSPDHWGYKTWLWTLIVSTAVVVLSFIYVAWK